MSVRSAKKVKPGACDEIPDVSVFAVDKLFRVLVVVADETPSSELSPFVTSDFFFGFRFFRGLLRALVGESISSSVLATSLPAMNGRIFCLMRCGQKY